MANPPVTTEDAARLLYRQASEETWRYGTLVDLRRTALDATSLVKLVERARDIVDVYGLRGPLALVAWERLVTERLTAYADSARALSVAVEVFHNIDDAERWLDAQLVELAG